MPTDEYVDRVLPFLAKRGLEGLDRERVKQAIPMIRERATTFVDAADRLDFVFRDPPVVDAAAQPRSSSGRRARRSSPTSRASSSVSSRGRRRPSRSA